MQIYNNLFSVANAPIGVIFGSQWRSASRAHCGTMENVRILFAHLLKLNQCDFLGFLSYLVDLAWGFSPSHIWDPNMGEIVSVNVSA